MAPWQAVAGATLLIPSGPRGENHLHVVVNDPKALPGYGARPCVVLVNLTTVRDGAELDDTCILEAGCHPFVKQASFILYRLARIEPRAHVDQLVKQGFFKPQQPLDAVLLAKIKAGLKTSSFTKREIKQLDLS
jgi:hypothetical protein